MTRTQKATVILLIVYFLYEYFLMTPWASGREIIRVDLLLIIPFLGFFMIKSVVQIFTVKKKQTEVVIPVDHEQKVTVTSKQKQKIETENRNRKQKQKTEN